MYACPEDKNKIFISFGIGFGYENSSYVFESSQDGLTKLTKHFYRRMDRWNTTSHFYFRMDTKHLSIIFISGQTDRTDHFYFRMARQTWAVIFISGWSAKHSIIFISGQIDKTQTSHFHFRINRQNDQSFFLNGEPNHTAPCNHFFYLEVDL